MAISTMLASMADWWTPTVLFCVLNLMIITIFVASNFKSPNDHHHHDNMPSQLTRSPSLLERVKSVNLSSFYTSTPESDHQSKVHSETTEHDSVSQLSRPPSLLQRVKSIEFSFSSFHNSFHTESEQLGNSPTKGARSLSLLDRVKSFKLSAPLNSDQHKDDSVEDDNITSVSEKSSATPVNESPGKLIESGSVKKVATSNHGEENNIRRRLATKKNAVRVHDESVDAKADESVDAKADESVDAKADDFIKRFKQQLKLQRLDSLQRFREMLNRGTSSS